MYDFSNETVACKSRFDCLLELGLRTRGFKIFKEKVTQFMNLVCHQDLTINKYMS